MSLADSLLLSISISKYEPSSFCLFINLIHAHYNVSTLCRKKKIRFSSLSSAYGESYINFFSFNPFNYSSSETNIFNSVSIFSGLSVSNGFLFIRKLARIGLYISIFPMFVYLTHIYKPTSLFIDPKIVRFQP